MSIRSNSRSKTDPNLAWHGYSPDSASFSQQLSDIDTHLLSAHKIRPQPSLSHTPYPYFISHYVQHAIVGNFIEVRHWRKQCHSLISSHVSIVSPISQGLLLKIHSPTLPKKWRVVIFSQAPARPSLLPVNYE